MSYTTTEFVTLLSMLYAHTVTMKALSEWETEGIRWKQKQEQKDEEWKRSLREAQEGTVRFGTTAAQERSKANNNR
jgi:hypothetical protein